MTIPELIVDFILKAIDVLPFYLMCFFLLVSLLTSLLTLFDSALLAIMNKFNKDKEIGFFGYLCATSDLNPKPFHVLSYFCFFGAGLMFLVDKYFAI